MTESVPSGVSTSAVLLRDMICVSFVFPARLSAFLFLTVAACSSPPVPVEEEGSDVENSETKTGSASTSSGSPTTKPSNSSTPGPDGPSGDGSESASPTTEPQFPVPEDHVPVVNPDYPGIDVALAGETAPRGCSDGYDPEAATVEFVLDKETPGVRLHVEQGVLHANATACSGEEGEPLEVEGLRQVRVRGGAEANLVIVDFSIEGFGTSLFEEEGGFHLDAGQGEDALFVRGSAEADEFYAGATNTRFVAAFSGVARVNLFAKSFESSRTSLGPGDDTWAPIGHLNVGLFDLDSRTALQINGIDIAQRIWGGDGDDELNGGAFDDEIIGGDGNDVMSGWDGNDEFDEASRANGGDVVNGGLGLDEVGYGSRTADVNVELCESDAPSGCDDDCGCEATSGEQNEGDVVVNVESVRSGDGNDTLTAGSNDNYLYAGEGNDVLIGGAGSDVLQGGEGDDEFDGGDDEDICDADDGEAVISCEV